MIFIDKVIAHSLRINTTAQDQKRTLDTILRSSRKNVDVSEAILHQLDLWRENEANLVSL
jgi:hypothetical protein